MDTAIDVASELVKVTDHWTPLVVGRVNNQYVKVASFTANSSGTGTSSKTSCSW